MQTLNMLLSAVDYDNMYVIATLSILPLMLLMFICGISVQLTFKKNAKKVSASGLTGAEAARKILDGAGLSSTLIAQVLSPITTILGTTPSIFPNRFIIQIPLRP